MLQNAQLSLDLDAVTPEKIAQALVEVKHKTKKLADQAKELSLAFQNEMIFSDNKTIKVVDGQVTLRVEEQEVWASDEEIEASLKAKRKYSTYLTTAIDYDAITLELLEEHGLLGIVTKQVIDKDQLRADMEKEIGDILKLENKYSVAVTLTKKKAK